MKISQGLKNVKSIFDKYEWCKGSYYRNAKGEPTNMLEAKQCCLLGAIMISERDMGIQLILEGYLKSGIKKLTGGCWLIPDFNDLTNTTKELAMQALDLAIQLAEEDEY